MSITIWKMATVSLQQLSIRKEAIVVEVDVGIVLLIRMMNYKR